jgi:hypothetical protein
VKTYDTTNSDLAYSLCFMIGADESSIWPAIPRPGEGSFSPPSCTSHRRAMTNDLGGWRDYTTTGRMTPEVELWRRAQTAGKTLTFVPRLTGIKFPAGWRRDVYLTRPSHEQAQWLARIDAEPDLEMKLLANFIVADAVPSGVRYRELLRHVIKQTLSRIRRRFTIPRWSGIDRARRFKGLRR